MTLCLKKDHVSAPTLLFDKTDWASRYNGMPSPFLETGVYVQIPIGPVLFTSVLFKLGMSDISTKFAGTRNVFLFRAQNNERMIDLRAITKSFGALQVLKGIDLHINKGEVVSIVGPSGAGKTTLLQIMGTLYKPDEGSVTIDGIDVNGLGRSQLAKFRNAHLGFVFQFHQLLPEFTAYENVMIPALIAKKSSRDVRQRAKELLQFMGLSDRMEHKPGELSGGEKQRVAVARALINNPSVVLADEPSGSLDSRNKEELHHLFFDLRDRFGQTFVIVTHDEGLATLTDRTVHMKDGLIVHDTYEVAHPDDIAFRTDSDKEAIGCTDAPDRENVAE